jgi:hypothetical protein
MTASARLTLIMCGSPESTAKRPLRRPRHHAPATSRAHHALTAGPALRGPGRQSFSRSGCGGRLVLGGRVLQPAPEVPAVLAGQGLLIEVIVLAGFPLVVEILVVLV